MAHTDNESMTRNCVNERGEQGRGGVDGGKWKTGADERQVKGKMSETL
jgi:hypothetical protein